MQRGRKFEKEIEKVIAYIETIGGHGHKNYAHRTQDGIYLSGECFDYEIFLKEYKAVFDAKEVEGDTWHILEKDIKQCNELKKCKNVGIDAYFLVCFKGKEVKQIDVDIVIEYLRQNKKSIKKEIGAEWELLKILNTRNKNK